MARGEQRRGADYATLLVAVNGQRRGGEYRRAAAADFDEHEAATVEHDQVDLAAARSEIADDGPQPVTDEIAQGRVFGPLAYGS